MCPDRQLGRAVGTPHRGQGRVQLLSWAVPGWAGACAHMRVLHVYYQPCIRTPWAKPGSPAPAGSRGLAQACDPLWGSS